jgi:predicted nucleic acid-binding protein
MTDALLDTSTAVPLVLEAHPRHAEVTKAVGKRRAGLAGHAAFEMFATLSTMPSPNRRTLPQIRAIFEQSFPATVFLGPRMASRIWLELTEYGLAGGQVYDALVGAAAVEHRLPLLTRDRRALGTYAALGVDIEIFD